MNAKGLLVTLFAVFSSITTSAINTTKNYPVWPFDFMWTDILPVNKSDWNCLRIAEPHERLSHFWGDNFLCYKNDGFDDPGMTWSDENKPDKPGLKCINFWEPSDLTAWKDNYLCIPQDSPFDFKYSYKGCYKDLDCISVNEPKDPAMWSDNYLCNKRTGRFNDTYKMPVPCVSFVSSINEDFQVTSSIWLTLFFTITAYIGLT